MEERLERAKIYMDKCAGLGSFNLKSMNPQNAGMQFVCSYLYSHRDKVIYSGDIAKASGVSTARVAAALNNLEEKRLICRIPSEKDSRKTVVKLTEEGTKFMEKKGLEVLKFTANVLDIVGLEDMDEFLRIAGKIKNAMETLEKNCKNHSEEE